MLDKRECLLTISQVQLMRDIYSRAAKVVVWLGPSNLQIDKLFDLLNGFHIVELPSTSARPTEVIEEAEPDTLRVSLKENSGIHAAI